jgi:hypothetical protein
MDSFWMVAMNAGAEDQQQQPPPKQQSLVDNFIIISI